MAKKETKKVVAMEKVESSMISQVGYDKENKQLMVQFLNGGIYSYDQVEEKVYKKLIEAESKGKYFLKKIKDKYEAAKV